MHSALYLGQLRHRRFAPRSHEFSYPLFMIYLDLSELDCVFARRWLWSTKRPAVGWFKRADYLGDPNVSLEQAVRDRVQKESGVRPEGPIRMLTHLRFFGFGFNPVTFYYCFDTTGAQVETIIAEITNTPWKEKHAYVLPRSASVSGLTPSPLRGRVEDASPATLNVSLDRASANAGIALAGVGQESPSTGERNSANAPPLSLTLSLKGRENRNERALRFQFKKKFHVSPFMDMDFDYDWRFSAPGERLSVHMENLRDGQKSFDATLGLERRELTGGALARVLLAFPCMPLQVVAGIYWQALKLWHKRIPFHSNPSHIESVEISDHERHASPPSRT